jgi:hypothetical protein
MCFRDAHKQSLIYAFAKKRPEIVMHEMDFSSPVSPLCALMHAFVRACINKDLSWATTCYFLQLENGNVLTSSILLWVSSSSPAK